MLDSLLALRKSQGTFAELTTDELTALAPLFQERELAAGELLFSAGDRIESLFVLLEGKVGVEGLEEDVDQAKKSFAAGAIVGTGELFSGGQGKYEARCAAVTRLAVLSREALGRLVTDAPKVLSKLEQMGLDILRQEKLTSLVDQIFGPFGPMLPYVLQEIEEDVQWITLRSGETLYEQGDKSDGAYMLVTGRLESLQVDDHQKVLTTIVSGETLGEVAPLTGRPRSSTVYAARDSEIVRLAPKSFEVMLRRSSRAMYQLSSMLVERLVHRRGSRDHERHPIRCISLIPASPRVNLDEFCESLVGALAARGSVGHLSSSTVDRALDAAGTATAEEQGLGAVRLTEWLYHQEDEHDFLVYQGDQQWSAWSARCARQADQVVVVADATEQPDLTAVEQRVSGPRRKWSLLLLHSPGTDRPRNTEAWLKGSSAAMVYHARQGNENDLARVERLLSGNGVGLVLGGGGARGFAHIGVLKVLEELGVPIDMVGGASMGAPIAGWVAQGKTADECSALGGRAYHKIIDFTLPLVSMLSGKRISHSIDRETAAWDIEDYWLPYYCVSTSLTSAQTVVHRRGNAAKAIRASVSIPGVLPPVPVEGEYLVDGGVLNNLPLDVMREMNPYGTVIGSDVGSELGPEAKSDYGTSLSGWRLLLGRIFGRSPTVRAPGLARTIMQSMVVGSALARKQMLDDGLADVYLNIHVKGVGMLQFDAQSRAEKLGYEQTVKPLTQWITRENSRRKPAGQSSITVGSSSETGASSN